MRVDGSHIWKEKVADSKICGYVLMVPKFGIEAYIPQARYLFT